MRWAGTDEPCKYLLLPVPPGFTRASVPESPFFFRVAYVLKAQLDLGKLRSSDAALAELVGVTEFSGDGAWFSDY